MKATNQNQRSSRVSVALDFVKPEIGDAFKTFLVGDIIDQKDRMGTYNVGVNTFVVGIGDGSKAFLSSSIPNLQFDVPTVGVDGFESEVNTNGGHIILVELIVCEPQQEATFSYWWVAHNDVFEEVIVLPAAMGHLNYFTTNDIITFSEFDSFIGKELIR